MTFVDNPVSTIAGIASLTPAGILPVTITNNKIATHAGHGLTDLSVIPLLEHKIFEEYNIGYANWNYKAGSFGIVNKD